MTETIVVEPGRGDRLHVRIGHHDLVADQPVSAGGADTGPTPTELWVAGYAACVAHYGSRYLRRHGLPTDGLGVRCTYSFSEEPPPRVESIELEVRLPELASERDRIAIQRVMERCTVGNSLKDPPRVLVTYRSTPALEPAEEERKEAVGDVHEHRALR